MALSSAFHERLEQMEHTRNQRLSLLQAEKSLQETKYQVFASKLTNIRSIEQRCLALDQKIASQNFKTSVLNSEIESLDAKYLEYSHKLRDLKSELEDLEELGKEKERFYELKGLEMKDFREKVERFVAGCRARVNELRNHVDELRSTFKELHGNSGYFDHWEIAAAEKRKSELLAMQESLNKNLASNYQLRAQYEKQLQNILTAHNEGRRREG